MRPDEGLTTWPRDSRLQLAILGQLGRGEQWNQEDNPRGWGFSDVPRIPTMQGVLLTPVEDPAPSLPLGGQWSLSRHPAPNGAPRRSPGHTPSSPARILRYPKAAGGRQSGVAMATGPRAGRGPQPEAARSRTIEESVVRWAKGELGSRRSGSCSSQLMPAGQGQVCCRGIPSKTTHSHRS